jgi:hypothetical protein
MYNVRRKKEVGQAWVADAILSALHSTYQQAKLFGRYTKPLPVVKKSTDDMNDFIVDTVAAGVSSRSQTPKLSTPTPNQLGVGASEIRERGSLRSSGRTTPNVSIQAVPAVAVSRKSTPVGVDLPASTSTMSRKSTPMDSTKIVEASLGVHPVDDDDASIKDKKRSKINSYQDERLKLLLDPLQDCIEKILVRYGYLYHGRKAMPTPYEVNLDQENAHKATSTNIAKIIYKRIKNAELSKVSMSVES